MTKIDIFSGFLGAGKTTLIKKLISESYAGQKLVLIENEFGEIGIDGGFLKDAGVNITEMNSGCICCSLVGDFGKALTQVIQDYNPDRILIEPSGVGKLSDVAKAVEGVSKHMDVCVDSALTVVDAKKCKMYMKNFGEFFNNQIEHAGTIVLSRTQLVTDAKLEECVAMLKERNEKATIITTPWDQLNGAQILAAMKHTELDMSEHHGHHHHHEHGEECECGCHGHHEHHEHHHHEHGEECECGCHGHHEHHEHHEHHHHEHGEECTCGCHGQHHDHEHDHHHDHHHGHHHADEVFMSWGAETVHKYTREELQGIMFKLDVGICGTVLRAKGIVAAADGGWLEFDHVPDESEIRDGSPDYTGRLCVIGADLKEDVLKELFHA